MSGPEPCALVTGASSGIGASFARALRGRGHRVVLVARRRERLTALQQELGGEAAAVVLPADLKAPLGVRSLVEEVRARGLRVELLVNSAGLGHTARFVEQPEERLHEMIDVNVRALVALTRAFLPGMVERRSGAVVNVASNAAFQPVPFMSVYAATKAFVLSFTEALANEVRGTGVKVQALCPGITATEFLEVAETHSGLLVTRMPMLTCEEVVEASLRGLDRGRLRVVPGLANRVLGGLVRVTPGALTRAVGERLYRPKP